MSWPGSCRVSLFCAAAAQTTARVATQPRLRHSSPGAETRTSFLDCRASITFYAESLLNTTVTVYTMHPISCCVLWTLNILLGREYHFKPELDTFVHIIYASADGLCWRSTGLGFEPRAPSDPVSQFATKYASSRCAFHAHESASRSQKFTLPSW